jgi:hypothetical protein
MESPLFSWNKIPKITTMLCSSLSTGFSSKILYKNVLHQIHSISPNSNDRETLLTLVTSLQIVNNLNLFQRNSFKVEQDQKTLKKLRGEIDKHFNIPLNNSNQIRRSCGNIVNFNNISSGNYEKC